MQANISNLYNKKAKDISLPIQRLYIFMETVHSKLTPPEIDELNIIIESLQVHNIEIIQNCNGK